MPDLDNTSAAYWRRRYWEQTVALGEAGLYVEKMRERERRAATDRSALQGKISRQRAENRRMRETIADLREELLEKDNDEDKEKDGDLDPVADPGAGGGTITGGPLFATEPADRVVDPFAIGIKTTRGGIGNAWHGPNFEAGK